MDETSPAIGRRSLIAGAFAAAGAACVGCSVIEEQVGEAVGLTPPPELLSGAFAARVELGSMDEVIESIRANDGFWYVPEGRLWVTAYPADALERARTVYSDAELVGMEAGIVALFQKCPHLGCRVPSCTSSQWFECPCHLSKYNQVGEHQVGPAPRGMDRFAVEVSTDGLVTVDTSTTISGPPIGVNTTDQPAAGPLCVPDGQS